MKPLVLRRQDALQLTYVQVLYIFEQETGLTRQHVSATTFLIAFSQPKSTLVKLLMGLRSSFMVTGKGSGYYGVEESRLSGLQA